MENSLELDIKREEDFVKLLLDKSFNCDHLCRICLRLDVDKKYSIFEGSPAAYVLIMSLTTLQISQYEDSLPQYMCKECKLQLEAANGFKIKCEHSDALLKKMLLKNYTNEDLIPLADLKKEDLEDENQNIDVKIETQLDQEKTTLNNVTIKKKKHKKIKKKSVCRNELKESPHVEKDICMAIIENLKEEINIDDDSMLYSDNDGEPVDEYIQIKSNSNEIKKVACKLCNKLLKSKLSLKRHMYNYHSSKKNATSVPYKIEGYGNQRHFVCTFCKYVSNRKQGIVGHVRIHTGEKPFKCSECPMYFPTSSALCNHKKVHSNQMSHTCPECGKQFKMKSKYEVHKSVHSTEKNFQCHLCNKFLKSKTTLQAHMFRHGNVKNYNCETCGATFVTCSELISHSKCHGGEKKFKCTICTFTTQTKAALDGHLLRHSGERKFECSLCEVKCFTTAALRNHMIRHTKEKKYSCVFCQQKFAHSSSLNRHMFKSHERNCKWTDLVDRRVVK